MAPHRTSTRRSRSRSDTSVVGAMLAYTTGPWIIHKWRAADPSVVRKQLALQMQIEALNNGSMVSDSTLSPSSTPFPAPHYNPRTFIQTRNAFGGRHGAIANSRASMRSSPSHQPVPLQPFSRGYTEPHHREWQTRTRLPPRVDSTQPWETGPDFSSGEETVGDFNVGEHQSERRHSGTQQAR
jgi:hypothetical protein